MSFGLQVWSPTKLRRVTCVACMPFVLAFIAFNILDLDGSNLVSLAKGFQQSIVDGAVDALPRIEPRSERVELLPISRRPSESDGREDARHQITELHALSRLENARSHHYHVSLPRDSVPG